VLEQSWAARPHPDVAEAYLAEAGDALGRAKAAEQLAAKKRQDPESRLLLARTALAASLSGRARGELDALLASGRADRRAYLAMAELELLEQGEGAPGRAAEARWLREAATAMPEPVWRCGNCGAAHEHWAPECGACGTVGGSPGRCRRTCRWWRGSAYLARPRVRQMCHTYVPTIPASTT
jgi:HemY protein